ncbi:MAG: hypothetical protein IPM35_08250 [Myxococcales bacterium]|nr:hypothetical protein [Myxococcales bacterium]
MRLGWLCFAWLLQGCGGGDGSGPPATVVGDGGIGGSGGDAAAPKPKIAFVTSTEYTSDFGSVAKADAQCATRAAEAGLSGSYMAWLSDSTSSPSTRFTRAEGNYVSVSGTVIAAGWTGLTSGSLKANLDYDEYSEQTTVGLTAWTGTAADGTATGDDCNDWSGDGQATVGEITAYGFKWSALPAAQDCAVFRHLYCFEQ